MGWLASAVLVISSAVSGCSCQDDTPLISAGAGANCVDRDGDRYGAGTACLGPDCDDADPMIRDQGSRSCYTGPEATRGVGACAAGTQTCTRGVFAPCTAEVLPEPESCDAVDNDCDGAVDEDVSRVCYSGPPESRDVGLCRAGVQSCTAGSFGECQGQVLPSAELCDNLDNDCDGELDEQVTKTCYSGPPDTERVGPCRPGIQTCAAGAFGACEDEVLPSAELCDAVDNDCNGQIDDGVGRACYAGPEGTLGSGSCSAGVEVCLYGAWTGTCLGQALPSPELCDGTDNDCDGEVDEGIARACYGGPSGTDGIGVCRGGTQVCSAGAFGACEGQVIPAAESCDLVDNDCDGSVDEALVRACYSGPAATSGVGLCHAGTQACASGAWGDCSGEATPSAEVCDGLDNDCDGSVDQGLRRACYTGPAGTEGTGLCAAGYQSCSAGSFGACEGQVLPAAEICDNRDNDCDGSIDETVIQACYTGPAGTRGVGSCRGGSQTCSAGAFGPCEGQVLPAAEACDAIDNDCDGHVDQGLSRPCYAGPAATAGVGQCRAGTQTCVAGAFGACDGQVVPAAETCDGQDNDCDGRSDEAEDLAGSCYGGPSATLDVGVCRAGARACTSLGPSCVGEILPTPETCDGLDNDCDGETDEDVVRGCYSGPAGTEGHGACRAGTQTCSAGVFGGCAGEVTPGWVEICGNGLDEDCDGQVDEPDACAAVGTYVCGSCSGASDANPGTQDKPLKTIARGIAQASLYGMNRVYVANRDATTANVYAEDLTMVEGISLEGRWDPTRRPWTRTSLPLTTVDNLSAAGLKVPRGVTRATVLDGFRVRSAGGVAGASSAAALTVFGGSPTLRDVFAGGMVPGSPPVATSVGLKVESVLRIGARPKLESSPGGALAGASGGAGTVESIGILVVGSRLEGDGLDVDGGQAGPGGKSYGVRLVDGAGTVIRASQIAGGNASTCLGMAAEGRTDGVSLTGSYVLGCEPGVVASSRGAGVLFNGCRTSGGTPPQVRANYAITGGTVPGGQARGIAALDGCDVEIADNDNVSGGSEALEAIGVLCASTSWSGLRGTDARCAVLRNRIYGGLSAGVRNAVGIGCEGGCLASGAACAGSCAEIAGNEVNAASGLELVHVQVTHSSPVIRGNRIGAGATVCLHQTSVVGLRLRGSGSRVENNFVSGGPCEKVFALQQLNEARADGSWAGPDVHSNTLNGGGSSASTTGSESYGIALQTLGTGAPRLGRYRSNIVLGGQNNHRTAFVEIDAASDPAEFRNNDLFNLARAGGAKGSAYLNEGSRELLTGAEVNALTDMDVGATLDVDPVFRNNLYDFHLQSLSPVRGMGTADGAPVDDLDGDRRALPAGSAPDIGADELP